MAPNAKVAWQCGALVIGKRPYVVACAQTFRNWAKDVTQFALDDFVTNATKI